MRPIKVGVIANNQQKIKTEKALDGNVPVNQVAEPYIDYTNFSDGAIMRFDEEKNCYYFSSSEDVIQDTFKSTPNPDKFTTTLMDQLEDKIDLDFGEY